jgi:hypothetical protein
MKTHVITRSTVRLTRESSLLSSVKHLTPRASQFLKPFSSHHGEKKGGLRHNLAAGYGLVSGRWLFDYVMSYHWRCSVHPPCFGRWRAAKGDWFVVSGFPFLSRVVGEAAGNRVRFQHCQRARLVRLSDFDRGAQFERPLEVPPPRTPAHSDSIALWPVRRRWRIFGDALRLESAGREAPEFVHGALSIHYRS